MSSEKQSHPEFDAVDFLNLALSPTTTVLGGLLLLARFRSNGVDPLAEGLYGKEEIEAALQQKHGEMFVAWLSLEPSGQVEDVRKYLRLEAPNQEAEVAEALDHGIKGRRYDKLTPVAASEADVKAFSTNLHAILQFLKVIP